MKFGKPICVKTQGRWDTVRHPIPDKHGVLIAYYYGKERVIYLWAGCSRRRSRGPGTMVIRPKLYFDTDVAMTMALLTLRKIMSSYKLTRATRRYILSGRSKSGYLLAAWRDILDRYLGVDLTADKVHLTMQDVSDLVQENRL